MDLTIPFEVMMVAMCGVMAWGIGYAIWMLIQIAIIELTPDRVYRRRHAQKAAQIAAQEESERLRKEVELQAETDYYNSLTPAEHVQYTREWKESSARVHASVDATLARIEAERAAVLAQPSVLGLRGADLALLGIVAVAAFHPPTMKP